MKTCKSSVPICALFFYSQLMINSIPEVRQRSILIRIRIFIPPFLREKEIIYAVTQFWFFWLLNVGLRPIVSYWSFSDTAAFKIQFRRDRVWNGLLSVSFRSNEVQWRTSTNDDNCQGFSWFVRKGQWKNNDGESSRKRWNEEQNRCWDLNWESQVLFSWHEDQMTEVNLTSMHSWSFCANNSNRLNSGSSSTWLLSILTKIISTLPSLVG